MNSGPENIRRLKKRISKGKRSISSRRWLERQINDPFSIAASEGIYRSRSAYKLIELNNKFKLFKKGDNVLDLGSSPGGWSQVVSKLISSSKHGNLVAIDIKKMELINGVHFINGDIKDEKVINLIKKRFINVDVVISDIAPNSIGHKSTDQIRSQILSEKAFEVACIFLKNNGNFCCKIITGGEITSFVNILKYNFQYVKRYKPVSSQKDSAEIFLVGLNYRQDVVE